MSTTINKKEFHDQYSSGPTDGQGEGKEYGGNGKLNMSKYDFDLFKEENDLVESVLRVKRTSTTGKGEAWRLMEDGKIVMVIEGDDISGKAKDFLRTADGFNFLIRSFKDGVKTFNKMKAELNKKVKTNGGGKQKR